MNISLTQTKNSHQFNGKIQLATYLKISETEITISAEPEVIKEFDSFLYSHAIVTFKDPYTILAPIKNRARDKKTFNIPFSGNIRKSTYPNISKKEIFITSASADVIKALDSFFKEYQIIGFVENLDTKSPTLIIPMK